MSLVRFSADRAPCESMYAGALAKRAQRCASRSIAQDRKPNRPSMHWHRCIDRGYSCAWATSGWYGCRGGRSPIPYAASAAELHALFCDAAWPYDADAGSEDQTAELQTLMRIAYAVF